MEERVALVSGTFKIWPMRRGGTEIYAFIPLNDPQAASGEAGL